MGQPRPVSGTRKVTGDVPGPTTVYPMIISTQGSFGVSVTRVHRLVLVWEPLAVPLRSRTRIGASVHGHQIVGRFVSSVEGRGTP